MTKKVNEADLEDEVFVWFSELGYEFLYGPDISPNEKGEPGSERDSYSEVVLNNRLFLALSRINPEIKDTALTSVVRKIIRPESQLLMSNNHEFHKMLIDGVPIEYRRED